MTGTESEVETAALESYLAGHLDGHVTETEIIDDGLNLLVAVSTSESENGYVIRRPNKLRRAEYMNGLKREFDVMTRLEETPVPVPSPVLFCADESILGDRFFVMTSLDGAVVPLGSDLPERFRNATARRRIAYLLVDTLADLHAVDTEPFESVCDRVTPRRQVERSLARLDESRRVTSRDLPRLRSVGEWLLEHAPSNTDTTLVHGDFRPGNVLFAGEDRPEITGVIDWETAMIGDPLTELGYLSLRWCEEGDPRISLDELDDQYSNADAIRTLREWNDRGLCPFTGRPGSPSRRELLARYEAETGRSFENERFYRAQAAFMLATVWEDLHRHRIVAGEDSDWPPYVEYMSLIAERIVDGTFEL